ncbi:MAG: replication-associated recombination protein A [Patescibacteria group bacterium]
MATLFDAANEARRRKYAPLADRMRPVGFDEVVGQQELVKPGSVFRTMIESGNVPSMIFWGPPGSGKTTLAKVIANVSGMSFSQLSAVTAGVAEVRQVIREAENLLDFKGLRSILFIDEIHRFNKGQQDAFLPFVENGTMILIGATTENPSFEVNSALLSRCKVFVLNKLEPEDVKSLVRRAVKDPERGYGKIAIDIPDQVLEEMTVVADGDARIALNTLEFLVKAVQSQPKDGKKLVLKSEDLKTLLQRTHVLYDKAGEEHYNVISALHKSMRGSDADAALYWLGRMLEGGEDPLYVARRLVRFASEDVGLADPNALVQAVAGYQACHFIGMPECNVILAQVVAYLARAKKSNALYEAYGHIAEDIRNMPNEPVPLHIRNAPTKLMKNLGYGKGYKYNPAFEEPVEQDYLPEKLKGKKYLDL